MKLAWGDAVFAGSSQSGPNQGGAVTKPVLFGMGTACLVILLLFLAGDWYRQHVWLLWTPRELWLFYLVMFLIAIVPGGLVGLLVDRQLRLDALLADQTAEIAATRCDLAQTNRNLRALIAVNHELIRATDESSLFQRICQVLADQAGYGVVWVAMIEPGPDKRVRVAARAGEQAHFLEALDVHYDDSPRGQGPTGSAIRENRVVVVHNSKMQAVHRNWPDRPVNLDWIASAVALPLRLGERVVGALTMYEPRARDYDQEELTLLTQLADDVSYGLRFLRIGEERGRTGHLLRQALRVSAAMTRTSRALVAGTADIPAMARTTLHQAMALTESPWGGVARIVSRTGHLDWVTPTEHTKTSLLEDNEGGGLYPDDSGRYGGPWADVLNDGTSLCRNAPLSLEGSCPDPETHLLARQVLAVPPRDQDGQVSGLLFLADGERPYRERDVRAVQRLAVLLDMGIARRRVEEELVLARRRAEAASEAKTQFLANISQELRTPINGILGMAQLALLESASERETEYWRTVRESTDRLVEIVDNLLELANVETGSLSPVLREFSLRRIMDSLRGAYSIRAGLAGLPLEVTIDPGIPDRLLGDPFRLRQILSNLIDNAIRFTPTGSVTVRVLSHDPASTPRRVFVGKDFQGLCLAFTVTDTGIGIPHDRQAAIFESFTLGEDYLTKRFGGTGMGLTIARRLAELLGGSIWVESKPGFGSTFSLTVPLWPGEQAESRREEPAGPVVLAPLRILVVEDEAVNRLALARGLHKLGHTVIEAGNGEEALRQLAKEQVDVVVMDIQMPVMDGLTAVGFIRAGEVPGTDRRLPVVALTAYALEGDRKRFLDAGMDEFVTKPCDMDQLLRAVGKVVGARAAA